MTRASPRLSRGASTRGENERERAKSTSTNRTPIRRTGIRSGAIETNAARSARADGGSAQKAASGRGDTQGDGRTHCAGIARGLRHAEAHLPEALRGHPEVAFESGTSRERSPHTCANRARDCRCTTRVLSPGAMSEHDTVVILGASSPHDPCSRERGHPALRWFTAVLSSTPFTKVDSSSLGLRRTLSCVRGVVHTRRR